MNKKQKIKINQNQLKQIVTESVKKVLNENTFSGEIKQLVQAANQSISNIWKKMLEDENFRVMCNQEDTDELGCSFTMKSVMEKLNRANRLIRDAFDIFYDRAGYKGMDNERNNKNSLGLDNY